MINLKTNTYKSAAWILSVLLTVFFYGCVKIPDNCSDGNRFDPKTEFCFEGEALKKCGGDKYNPLTQACYEGKVEPKRIVISFNTNGGIPITIQSVIADSGAPFRQYAPTPPTQAGFDFVGWFDETNLTLQYTDSTIIIASVRLTARWQEVLYTVTYNGNTNTGGTAPTSSTYRRGTMVTVLGHGNLVKTDHIFNGWNTAANGSGTRYNAGDRFNITEDITLYAVWGAVFTDPRDGQQYRTVLMPCGNVWMAENLNHVTANSWCYNNTDARCQTYGRLYTWDAAMEACPTGWRLPTEADWNNLVIGAGDWSPATTTKLKARSWNGTDDFGFAALPGGDRGVTGNFQSVTVWGTWWGATLWHLDANRPYRVAIGTNYEVSACYDGNDKRMGFSVRCIKE